MQRTHTPMAGRQSVSANVHSSTLHALSLFPNLLQEQRISWLNRSSIAIERRMKLFITRKSTLFFAIVVSLLGGAHGRVVTAQNDDGRKVFRVGVFDGSSAEFAEGQPKGNVRYVASQSVAARDWYAFQPPVLSKQSAKP